MHISHIWNRLRLALAVFYLFFMSSMFFVNAAAASRQVAVSPKGMDPTNICSGLTKILGLKVFPNGYWHSPADGNGEYSCATPYKELSGGDNNKLKNNVALYGYGSRDKIKKLELALNINQDEKSPLSKRDVKNYADMCVRMVDFSLNVDVSKFKRKIISGIDFNSDLGSGYAFRFSRTVRGNGFTTDLQCVVHIN